MRSLLLSFALAAVVVMALAGTARAQSGGADKAAAEALFQQAKSLFEKQQYQEACAKFDASHQLEPSLGTVLYLGDCWEKLGKKASAWAAFKEAAGLAARENDTKRKNVAEVRAAALEPQVTKLTIAVAEPSDGMVVRRSGVEVPQGSWGAPLPVDAGTYTLEATAPGRRTWTREVTIKDGGEPVTIDVPALEPSGGGTVEPPLPEPPKPPEPPAPAAGSGGPSGVLIAGLVTGGVGLVGVVVGAIFGGLAKSANDESLDHCRTESFCTDEGLALRDDAKERATISTATFIPGAVLLGAGITMIIIGVAADGSAETSARRFQVVAGATGLDLRGTF
jgi:hypothetical protein